MFDDLTSWENLLLAYRNASRGKRGQPNVATFEYRLEDNLVALQRELRTLAYRPRPYTSFYIHEPKRRLISAADFRDRVVHHALCNLIEPLFEASFVDASFANRKGKGTHSALDRCQALARRFPFFLQVDVRKFFPSIDHAVQRDLLARKVEDARVLWLIDLILESGEGVLDEAYDMVYFPGDDLFAVLRTRGLPIGNLTSQFWANVYLNPLDHFIKRELRCKGYVRYVDDLVMLADNKRTLWIWKTALEDRLQRYRLTLHSGAHPRPVDEGIPFLGFVVFQNRRYLKRRKGIHFQRRLKGLLRDYEAGHLTAAELAAAVQGWDNHVRYANSVGLRKSLLYSVPDEVMTRVVSDLEYDVVSPSKRRFLSSPEGASPLWTPHGQRPRVSEFRGFRVQR